MIGFGLLQRGGFSPRSLFRAGEAGAFYDPSDLSSMSQNSDGSTAAAIDSPVGRILDKSGRGNHAIQATAAARPMLRRDTGGRLYLEFDGVDDFLRVAFACPQPFDRISAIRQIGNINGEFIFDGTSLQTGMYQRGGNNLAMNGGVTLADNGGLAVGTNGVVSERWNGLTSNLTVNNGTPLAGNVGANASDGISIGTSRLSAGFANIRLYGLIMISRALSDGEERRVRRFMAARAGAVL